MKGMEQQASLTKYLKNIFSGTTECCYSKMCICEMCLIPNNHIDCFKRKTRSCLFLCLLQQAIPFSYACYDHKKIKMKLLFYHLRNDS